MRKGIHNLAVLLALGATPARAVEAGTHDWLRFVGALNRPTMAEPAGAHGTIGTTMGLGAEQVATPDGAVGVAGNELNGATAAGETQRVPMAWLVKGTPWPVDFALSMGAAPDASFTVAAGHAQVTVFEAMGLPALSLRGGYSRVFGLAKTTMATVAGDAVVSYGFLRYFNVYGTVGAERSSGAYDGADESWQGARKSVGLRVTVLPPFVSLTGEAALEGGAVKEAVAKVGVGI